MSEKRLVEINAPAKINLFLKVLGKRPDGFHDIYSLVQTVDLCDTLHFSPRSKGIELVCDDPALPCDSSNLVWRAYEEIVRESGLSSGVRIELTKRIPIGAGLGGGSSDAAAILKGIRQLYDLPLETEKLAQIGAKLGSDIPLFFGTGSSIVSGRGERVVNVDVTRDYKVVLVVPDFAISTVWAYAQLRISLTSFSPTPYFDSEARGEDFFNSLSDIGNDFGDVVFHDHPRVLALMEELWQAGAKYVAPSGSGSSFFGLFDSDFEIEPQAVVRGYPGWTGCSLRPISLA